MKPACDAVELPWLLRKAMLLIRDLELEESEMYFETRLKAGGVLDVCERLPVKQPLKPITCHLVNEV